MFYVLIENARAVSVTTEYPKAGDSYDSRYQSRNDWKSFERVVEIAAQLTETTGVLYIGTDAGSHVSPRYDVIAAPVLGAKVTGAFNGDYYPEGEIVKISASLKRVETSTGAVFFRRKNSGAWIKNGTWSMVEGHISRLSPEF